MSDHECGMCGGNGYEYTHGGTTEFAKCKACRGRGQTPLVPPGTFPDIPSTAPGGGDNPIPTAHEALDIVSELKRTRAALREMTEFAESHLGDSTTQDIIARHEVEL